MIVTTGLKKEETLEKKGRVYAEALKGTYVKRKRRSIETLMHTYQQDMVIVGEERDVLYRQGSVEPFFYHPNGAMVRVKQWQKTGHDPLIDAAQLRVGDTFLDCTLGLGADSTLAKVVVGETGTVVGIEGSLPLAYLVQQGMRTWSEGPAAFISALRSIKVIHGSHREILHTLANESFDVVYFDPMFEQTIASAGMAGMKLHALYDDLSREAIADALRVARRRVVLKDHWQSERFEALGFHVIRRKQAAFHYGYIEK
ncbi:hypothetical protein E2L07_16930 [Halalkalibacterium halodurans]|uniref:class I SAM-dependent methyltransferase n=1 Tax=Halalkalibacterium halodurans TaxID=86665 RepID=UPI001067E38D|nr:class I SAM-dependent methyltransferase [Halalkalibacterium halodurans]TES50127.1 hypothetical protein E2L07_16930 [Halalkalibacterium halodurans]